MTSLLSMLDRFEQAAVTYETSTAKADRDELHAARRAIMKAFEELRSYAHEATKAITGLTSGGSEYFGKKIDDMYTADLPFCVERIRASHTMTREWLTKAVEEKQRLMAREAELVKALTGLLSVVDKMDLPPHAGGGVLPVEKALATHAARTAIRSIEQE